MPQNTVRLKGYREFLRACDRAGKDTKRGVRSTLRQVGDVVKHDAAQRLQKDSPRSAAGFRTVVRQRGVSIEQSLRRTTGKRPDWGAFQMREALIPAVDDNQGETERQLEHALDVIADRFDR